MEWNTVERAINTEIDTRTEYMRESAVIVVTVVVVTVVKQEFLFAKRWCWL